MFYDQFKALCASAGVSCSKAAHEIGLSNATPTKWKKTGATPDANTLIKIADYFSVDLDCLLGRSRTGNAPHAEECDSMVKGETCPPTIEKPAVLPDSGPGPELLQKFARLTDSQKLLVLLLIENLLGAQS